VGIDILIAMLLLFLPLLLGDVRGSFARLFPISILLFSRVWLKEIDANGRMLLHLDQSLIERIKEIDANDPYPKQSKL
jgi:hypothetical protein